MQLIRTEDDLVTRIALVRAMRGVSHASLAKQLGVEAAQVLHWERGELVKPSMAKRLGLALRWPWSEFMLAPLPHDEAWDSLVKARNGAIARAE